MATAALKLHKRGVGFYVTDDERFEISEVGITRKSWDCYDAKAFRFICLGRISKRECVEKIESVLRKEREAADRATQEA